MNTQQRIAKFQALVNAHLAICKKSTTTEEFRSHIAAASRIVAKIHALKFPRAK